MFDLLVRQMAEAAADPANLAALEAAAQAAAVEAAAAEAASAAAADAAAAAAAPEIGTMAAHTVAEQAVNQMAVEIAKDPGMTPDKVKGMDNLAFTKAALRAGVTLGHTSPALFEGAAQVAKEHAGPIAALKSVGVKGMFNAIFAKDGFGTLLMFVNSWFLYFLPKVWAAVKKIWAKQKHAVAVNSGNGSDKPHLQMTSNAVGRRALDVMGGGDDASPPAHELVRSYMRFSAEHAERLRKRGM